MIIDALTRVSNAQAVTASAASTDYIDLGASRTLPETTLAITVDEAAAAAGAATVAFEIQSSDDSAFATFTTVAKTGDIGKAALTAGRSPIYLKAPEGQTPGRYVRVYYTVGTGPLTAGKFTAAFVAGAQDNRHYPDAI